MTSAGVAAPGGWIAARFEAPTSGSAPGVQDDPGSREMLEATLWSLGCAGVWEAGLDESADPVPLRGAPGGGLVAFFPDAAWSPRLAQTLAELGDRLGAPFDGLELVIDRDWMEPHRRQAAVRTVGRLVLDPREPEETADPGPAADELRILVPARRAFGTGTHESTRLILHLLQQAPVTGLRIAEVGCGSGVLSFAALRLGARRAIGWDHDPVSVFCARDNARLNRLEDGCAFFAGTDEAVGTGAGFDLALVNILPERIEGREAAIGTLVGAAGEVLVSGLLDTAAGAALERWSGAGWESVAELGEGEWRAHRLRRRSAVA